MNTHSPIQELRENLDEAIATMPAETWIAACHKITALESALKQRDERIGKLREVLTAFSESTDIVKEWCTMSDGASTKWFHGVVSGERATEALAEDDRLAKGNE